MDVPSAGGRYVEVNLLDAPGYRTMTFGRPALSAVSVAIAQY
jgi:hypothetical protein